MSELTLISQNRRGWHPTSINRLDNLLIKAIYSGRGYEHTYALRRNIAYNLQHIQFLFQQLSDLKMTGVLFTQTWKTIIIVGCGVIESLLHFLLIARRFHANTEWEKIVVLSGNPKKVGENLIKIDNHVYRKLPGKMISSMTFDAMIKKSEAKKILGSDHSVYATLRKLRPLRNKVHLQSIENSWDTDWNSFRCVDAKDTAEVLFKVFTSSIFRPSDDERRYFDYLARFIET